MKKIVCIDNSIDMMDALLSSKRVEGVLFKDKGTGMLTFKAYNRLPRRRPKDRLVCELEHGWMKESPQRYKFFSSVKKSLGAVRVSSAMKDDLDRGSLEIYLDQTIG